MATIDLSGGQSAIPWSGLNRSYQLRNRLDFGVTGAAASDTVNALKVKAGTHVQKVYVKVVSSEGGVATATVGDAGDADGYDLSVNLNAAAGTITQSTIADTYADGVIYSADAYITLTPGAAIDAAVLDVIAICEDLN